VAAPSQAAQGGPIRQVEGSEASRHSARLVGPVLGEKEAKYASDPRIALVLTNSSRIRNEAAIIVRLKQRWQAVHTRRSSSFAAATESKTQQAQILDQILGEAKSARQDNQGFIDNNVFQISRPRR